MVKHASYRHVFTIRDGYPVSDGHTLVIPHKHVTDWFEASEPVHAAIWEAVDAVKAELDRTHQPDGYNVGFNAGRAAGQTVMHHVHVIPRYHDDVEDPRGGVRGVIPHRQKYDASAPPAVDHEDPFASLAAFVPGESSPLLPELVRAIAVAHEVDLVSAFLQHSGLRHIEGPLADALERGASVRVLTGDYLGVTHPHALQRLHLRARRARRRLCRQQQPLRERADPRRGVEPAHHPRQRARARRGRVRAEPRHLAFMEVAAEYDARDQPELAWNMLCTGSFWVNQRGGPWRPFFDAAVDLSARREWADCSAALEEMAAWAGLE